MKTSESRIDVMSGLSASSEDVPVVDVGGSELSDRDRLAAAFADLRELGYFAPVLGPAWSPCCQSCALQAIGDLDESATGYAFWHEQGDYFAFLDAEGDNWPQDAADQLLSRDGVDLGDDDAVDQWLIEKGAELDVYLAADRLAHGTLLDSLFVYWDGDPDLIVSVLRRWGLNVVAPHDKCTAVEVLPTTSYMDRASGE